MLQKVYVKNSLTGKIYESFDSANNPLNTPLFTKTVMHQILKEMNDINKTFRCNISFVYDKTNDRVVCKDDEFKKGTITPYNSHMLYTNFGLMKLYQFGNEIEWIKVENLKTR